MKLLKKRKILLTLLISMLSCCLLLSSAYADAADRELVLSVSKKTDSSLKNQGSEDPRAPYDNEDPKGPPFPQFFTCSSSTGII